MAQNSVNEEVRKKAIHRAEAKIKLYDGRAAKARRWYYSMSSASLALTGITPVLVLTSSPAWLGAAVPAVAGTLTALNALANNGGTYRKLESAREALTGEVLRFEGEVGPYGTNGHRAGDNPLLAFINKVELVIQTTEGDSRGDPTLDPTKKIVDGHVISGGGIADATPVALEPVLDLTSNAT
jgi:hypothetical protein